VHPQSTVDRVLALCQPGVSTREVAKATAYTRAPSGVGVEAIGGSRDHAARHHVRAAIGESYSYLLGAYLGDGHVASLDETSTHCRCSAPLDRLGIAHRFPRPDTISVARREAVAALDQVVGPKS
jgi:hypothetical protein